MNCLEKVTACFREIYQTDERKVGNEDNLTFRKNS